MPTIADITPPPFWLLLVFNRSFPSIVTTVGFDSIVMSLISTLRTVPSDIYNTTYGAIVAVDISSGVMTD
jgi:hypothetical protein